MIIGYKKQFPWGLPTCFKGKIIDKIKRHTIREDVHDRWKPGMKIQHAYGVRSKLYEQFSEGKCLSIQKIEVDYCMKSQKYPIVIIDGTHFYNPTLNIDKGIYMLASNDGFDSIEDFFKWFNHDFTGKIIHWTDYKY